MDNDNGFKKKLLSGIFWRGCNVLFAFLFNALLVRQMGAGVSGHFFYLLNNLFFAALILGVGLESGISFYNARKEVKTSFSFTISITWSFIGAVFFFIILLFIDESRVSLKYGHLFMALYIFGAMLTTFLSAIYFTNHNSKVPNLVTTINNILLVLLLPKMPWINEKINFDTYILIYLGSALAPAIVLTLLLAYQKAVFSFGALKASVLRPLLLFSFHSFIIALLFNLLRRSDFWMVNKWCSTKDAGNYFQASKIIQLLLLLPAMASFSLYPLIVQSIKENEHKKVGYETINKVAKLVSLYFFVAFFFSVVIIIPGYWILPWLYGVTFSNLYSVTLLLIPGLIFFAASYPLTTFFSGKNQNITIIIFLSISIIILVVCNLLLTPRYFIYGAAISSSLANIVYFSLMLKKFLLQNNVPFRTKNFISIFEIKEMVKALGKSL